ncbi:S26 family signal peptidase [bacterium]|nr:S26 family signal peptidase [bacterium]
MSPLKKIPESEIFKMKVNGSSMKPFILPNDVLLIRSAEFQDFRIGDIALFKFNSHLIAHRIVHKNKKDNILWEMGDGKMRAYPVEKHKIIGKIIGIERNSRIISLDTAEYRFKAFIKAKILLLKYYLYRIYGRYMRVRVRDDPDYETKVGGVVPDPAIFKELNCYKKLNV